MAPSPVVDPTLPGDISLWPLLVVATIVLALGLTRRMAATDGQWGLQLRRRFVVGVPWGTLLTVVGVVSVYLFVQGGLDNPRNPLVIPFRSWSYFYPLGVVLSPFSHNGIGHVTSNVLGTLAFAPVVEYAWGHFPRERGTQSFSSLATNPIARILAFPAAVFVVGLLTGIFAAGPVVGFSGVVFAFAGFALVTYPIVTVLALVAGRILNVVWRSLQNPVITAEAGPRFVVPGWANIAIQGHLVGVLIGIVLGGLLVRHRNTERSAGLLFLGALAFAVGQSLWALYVPLSNSRFVLYRAAGTAFVFGLALLVAGAFSDSDGVLFEPSERLLDTLGVDPESLRLGRKEAAVGVVLVLTLATGLAAVPISLVTISQDAPGGGVSVRDYEVTYAENVAQPFSNITLFGVSLGDSTRINVSGVIVVNDQREVFVPAVNKNRLAFSGRETVVVGGLGWRKEVVANRTGWNAVGNETVYRVFLTPPDGDRRLVFRSDPATVEPRIDGKRIRVVPTANGFGLTVRRRNNTVGSTPVPTGGVNVTTAGITFNRTEDRLFALQNGTRVRIATRDGGRNN